MNILFSYNKFYNPINFFEIELNINQKKEISNICLEFLNNNINEEQLSRSIGKIYNCSNYCLEPECVDEYLINSIKNLTIKEIIICVILKRLDKDYYNLFVEWQPLFDYIDMSNKSYSNLIYVR